MTTTKTQRIIAALEAYLTIGGEVGRLCDQRERLLKRARRNGLRIGRPVRLSDGNEWELRKAKGKFIHFSELEFKKVPKERRSPESASTPRQSEAATAATAEVAA
jgi:hypothetical protein